MSVYIRLENEQCLPNFYTFSKSEFRVLKYLRLVVSRDNLEPNIWSIIKCTQILLKYTTNRKLTQKCLLSKQPCLTFDTLRFNFDILRFNFDTLRFNFDTLVVNLIHKEVQLWYTEVRLTLWRSILTQRFNFDTLRVNLTQVQLWNSAGQFDTHILCSISNWGWTLTQSWMVPVYLHTDNWFPI